MNPIPIFLVLLVALSSSLFGDSADALLKNSSNVDKAGLALEGYDPISYRRPSGPLKGHPSFQSEWKGIRYHFANEANLKDFEVNPERFVPACGGWCAWAMLDEDKVAVDPERFKLADDRLLVFYDGFWGNTLKKWNEKAETTEEAALLTTISENWSDILMKAATR